MIDASPHFRRQFTDLSRAAFLPVSGARRAVERAGVAVAREGEMEGR